jgi:hypothetical protein
MVHFLRRVLSWIIIKKQFWLCMFLSWSTLVFCSVWSAAVHALTAFIKCFISSDVQNDRVLLQPVLVYLNRYLCYFIYGCNFIWQLIVIPNLCWKQCFIIHICIKSQGTSICEASSGHFHHQNFNSLPISPRSWLI